MTDPVAFLLAVITLLITPGPTNTLMATAGTGPRRSPVGLLAAEVGGYLAIILLARFALLPLIDLFPPLGLVVKLIVVACLIYAAVLLWRGGGVAFEGGEVPIVTAGMVATTTFLNPKGLIFALSVFPREHEWLALYFAAFACLVILCGFAWFVLGRWLAHLAGRRATLLPRAGALALLGFAALLAVSLGR